MFVDEMYYVWVHGADTKHIQRIVTNNFTSNAICPSLGEQSRYTKAIRNVVGIVFGHRKCSKLIKKKLNIFLECVGRWNGHENYSKRIHFQSAETNLKICKIICQLNTQKKEFVERMLHTRRVVIITPINIEYQHPFSAIPNAKWQLQCSVLYIPSSCTYWKERKRTA